MLKGYKGLDLIFGNICFAPDEPGGSHSGGDMSGDVNIDSMPSGGFEGDLGIPSVKDDGEGDGDGDDNKGDDGKGDDGKGEGDKTPPDTTTPPANAELTDSINKLLGGLKEFNDSLTTMKKGDKTTDSGKDVGGKVSDLLAMEHDDLVDLISQDPKNFVAQLTKSISGELTQQMEERSTTDRYNRQVEETFSGYAKDNPDFEKMWDSGELKTYMDKNPGHNAISAHMMLTINKRIEDAKKEGEQKAINDFKTKKQNQVLGSNGSVSPITRSDKALKSMSRGNAVSSIAERAGIKK